MKMRFLHQSLQTKNNRQQRLDGKSSTHLQAKRNWSVLLKLLRSIYFLTKSRIPHTSTFKERVELQIANGDDLLKQHVEQGPSNAKYTSKFLSDTYLDREKAHI